MRRSIRVPVWTIRIDERQTLRYANDSAMALTMTHTRTQTALTRLAKLLANLNGELAFLDDLMVKNFELVEGLADRRDELRQNRTVVQLP